MRSGQRSLPYVNDPPKLLRATAYHEAGHAVVGYRFGKRIRERGISIDRDLPGEGHTHLRQEFLFPLSQISNEMLARYTERRLRAECMEMLAGYASEAREMRVRGLHGGIDWDDAISLVRQVRGISEVGAQMVLQSKFLPAVRRLLRVPAVWIAVETLAQALLDRGVIAPDEAQMMLERRAVGRVSPSYWR
jgi:hypothetical protein